MNFFGQDSADAAEWMKFASSYSSSEVVLGDLLALAPYMYDDYVATGSYDLANVDRYYYDAIEDGCLDLSESLIRIILYKIARDEPLDGNLKDYLGSALHLTVNKWTS